MKNLMMSAIVRPYNISSVNRYFKYFKCFLCELSDTRYLTNFCDYLIHFYCQNSPCNGQQCLVSDVAMLFGKVWQMTGHCERCTKTEAKGLKLRLTQIQPTTSRNESSHNNFGIS